MSIFSDKNENEELKKKKEKELEQKKNQDKMEKEKIPRCMRCGTAGCYPAICKIPRRPGGA